MDFLIGFSVGMVCFITYYFFRNKREEEKLQKLHHMIQQAIKGTFQPETFDETALSAIESSMYRYLTDQYNVNKKLDRQKNQIQTMITDISHQTTTPISNISLYAQLVRENAEKTFENREAKEQMELIDSILEQTNKLEFLIQSLVKLSRLENGIIAVHPKEEEINSNFHAMKEQFREKVKEKNQKFTIHMTDDKTAYFDLKWTIEAISNIVDNAIKYTPNNGTIEIWAVEYEMFLKIDIKDNGIGIREEEISKIFQRFYRSVQVSNEPGGGIGLYLCREIIQAENGYIKVKSEPEKGSTFSVFLPK